MIYPFKFTELLLGDEVLRYIGFNNWWGDSGDGWEIAFGEEKENLSFVKYRLRFTSEESNPYTYGQSWYQKAHCFSYKFEPLYFLHELIEDINLNASTHDIDYLMRHFQKLSIQPYIDSYNKYKQDEH